MQKLPPVYKPVRRLVKNDSVWIRRTIFNSPTIDTAGNVAAETRSVTVTKYTYDADGIRTEKVINGVTHHYVTRGGKLMRESFLSGSTEIIMDFSYDEAGRPFAVSYSKDGGASFSTYYYATNQQGDVVTIFGRSAVTDEEGNTTGYTVKSYGYYTYDAWGNVTAHTATGSTPASTSLIYRNPLRYRGYVYDNETGFYYLQSRYYDPANHRFINADAPEYSTMSAASLNGANLFAYCLNDPVNRTDEAGAWSWKSVLKVVAAVAVVAVVTVAYVATAGAAAAAVGASAAVTSAVTTGAAVGGAVAGGSEIISQIAENGAENIDILSVGTKTVLGSAYGASRALAITGNPYGRIGVIAANSLNILYDGIRDGKPIAEIVTDTAKSATTTSVIQFCGAAKGSQIYGAKESIMTGAITTGKTLWRFIKNNIFDK